jgi:hypothetical protein
MPNHLEYVVRPSQSPQIRPGTPTQIFATPKIPENNPNTWGSAGNSVFALQASAQQELPQPYVEVERTYDVVRVYNPDDRTQFVDTEQMTGYKGKDAISNDRIQLRFNGNADTTNTEVISRGNKRTNPYSAQNNPYLNSNPYSASNNPYISPQ